MAKKAFTDDDIRKMVTWAIDEDGLKVPALFVELEYTGTTLSGSQSNKFYTIAITGTTSMFFHGPKKGADRYGNNGAFSPKVHDSIAQAIARCQKKFTEETAFSRDTPYKIVGAFRASLSGRFLAALLDHDLTGKMIQPVPDNPMFDVVDIIDIEADDCPFDNSNPGFKGSKEAYANAVKKYLGVGPDALDLYSVHEIVHNRAAVETMVGVASVNAVDNIVPVAEDELVRKNGQVYYPRLVGDVQDIALFRHLRKMGEDFCLVSAPGTGKTAAIEVAFPDAYIVQGDESKRAEDFLGQWIPQPDGNYVFEYGPAIKAAIEGVPLYVDEIGRIPDNTLAALNAFIDERGFVIDPHPQAQRDPETGETPLIKIEDGFILITSYNPNIRGSSIPADLRSRFEIINWSTDYELAKKFGCPPSFINLAQEMDELRTKHALDWAPEMRELKRVGNLVGTLGMAHCLASLVNQIPTPANREMVITDVMPRWFESDVLVHVNMITHRGLSAGRAMV